jgi:peptidoglycan/LPS O-acetylase OafA/YrhL
MNVIAAIGRFFVSRREIFAGLLAFAEFFAGLYGLLAGAMNWRIGVLGAISLACAVAAFVLRKSRTKLSWAFLAVPVVIAIALYFAADAIIGAS